MALLQKTLSVAALTIAVFSAHPAIAQFTFKKVVDTNTAVPNGTGNFTNLYPASISSGNIVFRGLDASSKSGIYSVIGGKLRVVADTNTPIPGTSEKFQSFTTPSISGLNIAFSGAGATTGGLYIVKQGNISLAAPNGLTVTNPDDTFRNFAGPAISGSNLATIGSVSEASGYSGNRDLAVIDGKAIGTPFRRSFSRFSIAPEPAIGGANVVSVTKPDVNNDSYGGVYLFNPKTGSKALIEKGFALPNGQGKLTFFDSPAISGKRIAFTAFSDNQNQGIYTFLNGQLTTIADKNTPLPGGKGNFCTFRGPAGNPYGTAENLYITLSGSIVAFKAGDCQQLPPGALYPVAAYGIYTNLGGQLQKVVAEGDQLDGKTVQQVFEGRRTLSGKSLVVTVVFTDGSKAIYRATLVNQAAPTNRETEAE
jgi:hypothetical protein